jgi:hypothetical protein
MAPTCTVTGAPGRRVSETTLTHLLREEALPRAAGREWFFCPDPDCDIIYFTADGETLSKDALTVRVGLKERGFPRPLCYCFGYDLEDVEREAAASEESGIAAAITEKCRQGLDRCEETNPQGSCCLGNIRRAFQEARRVRRETTTTTGQAHCCRTKPRKEDR